MRELDEQLFKAAQVGDAEAILDLISRGADAKARNFMGATALMVATLRDRESCVQALLPHSDARAVDEEGCSALIYACQHGRLSCAKLLAPASDMDRADREGMTATDHAQGDMELYDFLTRFRLAQKEAEQLAAATAFGSESSASSRL